MKNLLPTSALFAAASLVAFAVSSAANAADLGQPIYKTPAPAPLPPRQDWSGIYVGLEGGYGWGKQSTDAISAGDQFSATFLNGPIPFQLTPPLFFPDVAVPSIKPVGYSAASSVHRSSGATGYSASRATSMAPTSRGREQQMQVRPPLISSFLYLPAAQQSPSVV